MKQSAWTGPAFPYGVSAMSLLISLLLNVATVLPIGQVAAAGPAEIGYGVGDWPESLGNHRAVVHVDQVDRKVRFVQIRIP